MYSDNGRPCPRCGGTCYKYSHDFGDKWQAKCYGCGLEHYFTGPGATRVCSAAVISATHRAAREIGNLRKFSAS